MRLTRPYGRFHGNGNCQAVFCHVNSKVNWLETPIINHNCLPRIQNGKEDYRQSTMKANGESERY